MVVSNEFCDYLLLLNQIGYPRLKVSLSLWRDRIKVADWAFFTFDVHVFNMSIVIEFAQRSVQIPRVYKAMAFVLEIAF